MNKMPIANGDTTDTSTSPPSKPQHDYREASSLLETYKERDGLDIHGLLDTSKNGALTYNDFLVLPGYIGTASKGPPSIRTLTQPRLPCVRSRP